MFFVLLCLWLLMLCCCDGVLRNVVVRLDTVIRCVCMFLMVCDCDLIVVIL